MYWVSVIFFVLCSLLLLAQTPINTLFLGFVLLVFCFCILMLLSYIGLTWYGLLFFLLYVGGLLVLFFYVLSVNSNPLATDLSSYSLNLSFAFGILFFAVICNFYFSLDFVLRSSVDECSYFLFNRNECFFMIFLCFLLLLVLFLVNKFSFDAKSAIRPVKF
uniref:Nad6 protein n=1 Tax=Crenobia alpina TaxID=27898 RepID=A0A0C5D8V4_9PLAT|nr:NADH dehydrogenase subunit 6 [Crenobia alpina]